MDRSERQIAARRVVRRGFTLIEVMMTVTIILLTSSMAMVNVGAEDATMRLDRAAQEVILALRYARMEAMSHNATLTGTTQLSDAYGVQFDTTENTVTVYHAVWNSATGVWTLPGTAVSNPLYASGSYVVNFSTRPEYEGVTISSVQLTGTADTRANTANPYVCQYRSLGSAANYNLAGVGAVVLSCGGYTRTISIPQTGDPQEN